MTKESHHHPPGHTYKLAQDEYSPGSSTNQEPSRLAENLSAPCYLKPLDQATTGNHLTRQPQATTQPDNHRQPLNQYPGNHRQPLNHFTIPVTTFITITAAITTTAATNILLGQ